jgi:thioesterase domain-containing protein
VRGVTERIATSAGVLRARVRAATGRALPDALRRHTFVQANVLAADAYAASPYPGRITVFRATGELFDAPEVARTGLGWSVVAGGGIDVVDVPGDHMSIFEEPFVATLAHELDTVVRSACHEPNANPRSSAVNNGS